MGGHCGKLFTVIVVHIVNGAFLRCRFRGKEAVFIRERAYLLAVVCVIGDILCDDVERACYSGFCVLYALFFVDEGFRRFFDGGGIGGRLRHYKLCKRCKAALTRLRSTRFSFLLEGAVDILYLCKNFGGGKGGVYLLRHFALLRDSGANLVLALFKPAKVGKALAERAELLIVERARDFFAVTGDKGDGVSLIEKPDGRFYLRLFYRKLFRELCDYIHKSSSPGFCCWD